MKIILKYIEQCEDFCYKEICTHQEPKLFIATYLHVGLLRESQKFSLFVSDEYSIKNNTPNEFRFLYPSIREQSFFNLINQACPIKKLELLNVVDCNMEAIFINSLSKHGMDPHDFHISKTINRIMIFAGVASNHNLKRYSVIRRKQYFGEKLKELEPELYSRYYDVLAETFSHYSLESLVEAYYDVFIYYTMVINPILAKTNKKEILVYSDLGKEHERFILKNLSMLFPEHNYHKYTKSKQDDISWDFFISTMNNNKFSRKIF